MDIESITLTTAHAASSYGRPVLLIDGVAYGPADLVPPAGVPAAELVWSWAERFAGIVQADNTPSMDELDEWLSEGICEALDGCIVEPDGYCPHGSPSWLLHLGLI